MKMVDETMRFTAFARSTAFSSRQDNRKSQLKNLSQNAKYRTKNVSLSETQFQINSGLGRYDDGRQQLQGKAAKQLAESIY
jgi:hypothetical protein